MRHVILLGALLAVARGASPTTNAVNTYKTDGTLDAAGSLASCVAGDEAFPEKTTVSFGNFQVDYKKTYKRVVNTAVTPNKVYLLYQRGCPAPTTETAGPNNGIFAVPLTGVKVDSSTFFPWFEYMGDRGAIRGVNGMYTASQCMWKNEISGYTKDVPYGVSYDANGWYTMVDDDSSATTPEVRTDAAGYDAITSVMSSSAFADGPNPILLSDLLEKDYFVQSEWIKYVGLFMNREKTVDDYSKNVRERWVCHSTAANQNVVKKKILWASYYNVTYVAWNADPDSATLMGWEVRKCDHTSNRHRHCKLITAAGGIPAMADVSKLPEAKKKNDGFTYQGMTSEEMIPFLADVDVIILGSTYCDGNTLKGDYSATVSGAECEAGWKDVIRAVTDTTNPGPALNPASYQVYDTFRITDPLGGTDFNNGVHMEPDVILEDYIKTMYPMVNTDHEFVWLRNIMTEGVGSLHKCADDPTKVGCAETGQVLAAKCTDPSAAYVLHMTGGCGGAAGGVYPRWGEDQSLAGCALPATWAQLTQRTENDVAFETGGLGNLMDLPRFGVWLCEEGHACATGDSPFFCFVFDEVDKVFVPWGPDSLLQLTNHTDV